MPIIAIPFLCTSVLLSVITKILHGRLDPICEAEGYYGAVQYGFRKNRSTSDCIFILLAAIRRAKRKGQIISIACCDIAKAYSGGPGANLRPGGQVYPPAPIIRVWCRWIHRCWPQTHG